MFWQQLMSFIYGLRNFSVAQYMSQPELEKEKVVCTSSMSLMPSPPKEREAGRRAPISK
jgi:hypothetical protein